VNTVLLDCHIYDKLEIDRETCGAVRDLVDRGVIRIIATPMVVAEMQQSRFRGLPDWFPVAVEPESVTVVGYAVVGMTRVGDGQVFTAHRGDSKKTPDAIIADSANSLANLMVSKDRRSRERLKTISTHCKALDYHEFSEWVQAETAAARSK
jgi:hypothetical protein